MPPFDDSADAAVALDTFTDPTSTSSRDDFMLDPTSFSASLESNLTPDPAEKALTVTDYLKMSQMCEDYEPWQLADPSTKIAFTMSVFKKFHTGFAQNNCTAFLHRYLYKDKMPRCILQAFSMCLLYTNQTEANRGPLLRILHTNVTELKEMAGGTSLTPQEKLEREADDDMVLLESWNTELCKMRDNLDELDLDELVTMDQDDIRNKPPESWERWIFAESLRKTCIIGFSLKTFWDLLKRRPGYDGVGNWVYVHRWTLSSHLWDAPSSFDFFRAWKEKPMWVISAFKFEEFVKHGMGDDIDEFSRYFLTIPDMSGTDDISKELLVADFCPPPLLRNLMVYVMVLLGGDSEELLGKWFARTGKRSEIFLATKFGGVKVGTNSFGFRGDAEYVSEACDNSLKRLGVDYIDLGYPHRLDGSSPVEHIVAEMVKMKE
ncbi:hypothetical protein F4809DRAFT_663926 [Biscogniauxia mediterranea]|nr:hypothetical protein F4809DRAFT_663926 [Biscogniauxia mediterranea]